PDRVRGERRRRSARRRRRPLSQSHSLAGNPSEDGSMEGIPMTQASTFNGAGKFGDDDIVRVLAGGRILRRKRLRRLLVARLLRDRRDDEEGEDVEGVEDEDSGDEDRRLTALLIGGAARR